MIIPRSRVFLSYAHQDAPRAEALYDSLAAAGFEPWMDSRNIPKGADWQAEIDRGIQHSHAFLACISSSSVQRSGVLAQEIDDALLRWKQRRWWWQRRFFLVPVRFQDVAPPETLAHLQYVDVLEDKDWVRIAAVLRSAQRRLAAATASVLAGVIAVLIALTYYGVHPDLVRGFRASGGERRIGITLWNLQQVPSRPGSKELIHEPADGPSPSTDWKPFRVGGDSSLHRGDHVRITIETGREAYLYVIDQSLRTDNRRGTPVLIFPTKRIRGGDNHCLRREPVDLPDLQNVRPYWTLESHDPLYAGELITVFALDQPLPDIAVHQESQRVPTALFASWQQRWSVAMRQAEDRPHTNAAATAEELEAGNGNKTLGQEDPLPQMIFQSQSTNKAGLMVAIPIRVL